MTLLALLAPAMLAQPRPSEALGPPSPAATVDPQPTAPTAPPPSPTGEAPPEAVPPGDAALGPSLGPEAPGAGAPARRDDQLQLKAKKLEADHETLDIIATGNVEVTYRDMVIRAETLRANLRKQTVEFDEEGDLRSSSGVTIAAQQLRGRLGDRHFSTGPFAMVVPSAVAGYGITEPIRVDGASAEAVLDERYTARSIIASACPPNDRKYYLRAHEVTVRPNRSLTLSRATAVLFGLPIFGIGRLVVPLRSYRRMNHLPDFGRDDVYGFWARYRYAYDLAERQDGDVMAMMTEKRGALFGLTHNYGYGGGTWKADGRAEITYGTRDSNLSLRGSLNEGFGRQLRLNANLDLSQNTGFSSTTRQGNLTATLTHQTSATNTSLNYNHSDTSSANSHGWYQRGALSHNARLGRVATFDLQSDYNRRGYSQQPVSEMVDTRARLAGQYRLFDWEVVDQRHFDLTATQGGYTSNAEIVPQLTLSTDSRRLRPIGFWGLPEAVDWRFVTTLGQYRETAVAYTGGGTSTTPPEPTTTLRANFDLDGQLSPIRLGSRLVLSAGARYSQSFFDHPDPSAKYIMGFSPNLSWQPIPHQRLDFAYRFQEVAGYSPLQRFDFGQKINDLDVTWNWFLPDRIRPRQGRMALTVNGGLDLLQGQWRDVRVGLRAAPWDELYLDLSTSYSLEGRGYGDAGLRSVRALVRYDAGRRYRHEVGLTYDPRSGILGPINSLLHLELLPRVSLENALTWDGYTSKISYNDVMLNYDLGCVGITGSYRQQTNEWRLDLNLKAFQNLGNLFGTGRYGQVFSTSPGVAY